MWRQFSALWIHSFVVLLSIVHAQIEQEMLPNLPTGCYGFVNATKLVVGDWFSNGRFDGARATAQPLGFVAIPLTTIAGLGEDAVEDAAMITFGFLEFSDQMYTYDEDWSVSLPKFYFAATEWQPAYIATAGGSYTTIFDTPTTTDPFMGQAPLTPPYPYPYGFEVEMASSFITSQTNLLCITAEGKGITIASYERTEAIISTSSAAATLKSAMLNTAAGSSAASNSLTTVPTMTTSFTGQTVLDSQPTVTSESSIASATTSVSIGAINGILFGAVGGLALIAGLVFLWRRQRAKNISRANLVSPVWSDQVQVDVGELSVPGHTIHEMGNDKEL